MSALKELPAKKGHKKRVKKAWRNTSQSQSFTASIASEDVSRAHAQAPIMSDQADDGNDQLPHRIVCEDSGRRGIDALMLLSEATVGFLSEADLISKIDDRLHTIEGYLERHRLRR